MRSLLVFLLAAAGAALLALGIADAVNAAAAIDGDAVARGTVGQEVSFESGEPKLTVYLDTDGVPNVNDAKDRLANATSCTVTAKGFKDSFSGSRQGASATLGDWVSVGSFTLPGSSGRIACTGPGTPFVVTPHGAGETFKAVGMILAGAFLAVGGIILMFVSYFRRRGSDPSMSSSAATGSPTTLR